MRKGWTGWTIVVLFGWVHGSANPIELGTVRWQRDVDIALESAQTSHKPLFLLFQEIPGCATCVGFGQSALAHPLLVDAIESSFIPVAVHNNKPGQDAKMLARYREPAWNNPVVRFLNGKGRDVIPRQEGVWSAEALVLRMIKALETSQQVVPGYLAVAAEELNSGSCERAMFEMGCYWYGEAHLGSVPGVKATKAVDLAGREAVEVIYDPKRISLKQLVEQANAMACATRVTVPTDRQFEQVQDLPSIRSCKGSVDGVAASVNNQQYHLNRSNDRWLPMTPLQAVRVNAALGMKTDPDQWLSPRQVALRQDILTTLKKNAHALKGLVRPTTIEAMQEYERLLRERCKS